MFFPCPHCQFLVAYHPHLRPLPADCPRCGGALEEPAAVAGEDAPAAQAVAAPARATAVEAGPASAADEPAQSAHAEPEPAPAAAPEPAPEPEPELVTGADPAAPSSSMPARAAASAARVQAPHLPARAARWQWPAVAALALLLPLQAALADRHRLAADPTWRPAMEALCGVLRCELPPWRAPGQFRMLHSQIRRNARDGVLRLDATFRNDARWPQPWPALQLALADADGRTLGSTVVAPAQYLGQQASASLAPGQSAQVSFAVREPEPGTVGFSLRFR